MIEATIRHDVSLSPYTPANDRGANLATVTNALMIFQQLHVTWNKAGEEIGIPNRRQQGDERIT